MKKLSELTIFFPAYNEAGNIEEAVKQALTIAPHVAKKYEILVINDGSKDATKQIVQRLEKKYPSIVRLINQRNKGYGGALKRGFREAKYEWIFFTDSDLQFDLNELQKFISQTSNNNLVLGYRLNRAEGFKRVLLARMLKVWNRILLGFPRKIKDIDCAFKLIHRSIITSTYPLLSDGAMVSTELLLKAHGKGFKYAQIGVRHYQRRIGQPTGSNFKVILRAVIDTFRLKYQLTRYQMHTIKINVVHSLL